MTVNSKRLKAVVCDDIRTRIALVVSPALHVRLAQMSKQIIRYHGAIIVKSPSFEKQDVLLIDAAVEYL